MFISFYVVTERFASLTVLGCNNYTGIHVLGCSAPIELLSPTSKNAALFRQTRLAGFGCPRLKQPLCLRVCGDCIVTQFDQFDIVCQHL